MTDGKIYFHTLSELITIINNQNMQQQPIINNYYSINTNNQSNAPVKVINVYNQNQREL